MTRWLLVLALLFPVKAVGQSEAQCERAAIHFEAGNQGILTQKAVLEVVRARVKASGKSICQVLLEKHQFPWANSKRLKIKLDGRQRTRYDIVRNSSFKVLPSDKYKWFNKPAHKWGKGKIKIGDLTFNTVDKEK